MTEPDAATGSETSEPRYHNVHSTNDMQGASDFARSLDHGESDSALERQELPIPDPRELSATPQPTPVTIAAPPSYQAPPPPTYETAQGRIPEYHYAPWRTEAVLNPSVDASGMQSHLRELPGHLEAAAQVGGSNAVAYVAQEVYRNPNASTSSVRMAFDADMDARRRVRNAQPGLSRFVGTLFRAPHANSVLEPTINHAVNSVRGHRNATLVADAIEKDGAILARLRRRESPRSGGSNADALRRDLDGLRQTQPPPPSTPASASAAANAEERQPRRGDL